MCIEHIMGVSMRQKKGIYERYIKRPQDFILSLLALIVLSPIIIVTAIIVRIKLGAPVIFSQQRPGLNSKVFKLYKFRTMSNAKDENGNLLSDEERLGKFGKTLRSTSLDELPSLINILKGDMSIVGPRPLLVRYLDRYNEHQARRHEVRPGFTGYAQVNGRNAITWEQKFDYDVEYVDNITFIGDWKIIFKTALTVIKREGISSDTSATMEEFMGTEAEYTKNQ
jgi:lipopolysaccharide/colanic/teichoic acid biosynthesis glycosyltransferase